MSRLLPSEKFISLPPSLAGRVGIVPALILCELSYRAGHRPDGADYTKWVEASIGSLRSPDCLGFIPVRTLERCLSKLRSAGVIETRASGGFDRSNVARIWLRHPLLAEPVDNSPPAGGETRQSGGSNPAPVAGTSRHGGGMKTAPLADSLLLESKNQDKNPERGKPAQKAPVQNLGTRNPEPEVSEEQKAINRKRLAALAASLRSESGGLRHV